MLLTIVTRLQVLVSIQSLILVEQPYFNEPGYEAEMRTPRGKLQSDAYNFSIRAETVRLAMIDAILNPPRGFQEVVSAHFRARGKEILRTVDAWIDELDTSIVEKRIVARKNNSEGLQKLRQGLVEALGTLGVLEEEIDDCGNVSRGEDVGESDGERQLKGSALVSSKEHEAWKLAKKVHGVLPHVPLNVCYHVVQNTKGTDEAVLYLMSANHAQLCHHAAHIKAPDDIDGWEGKSDWP